jgi:hypothetical protein
MQYIFERSCEFAAVSDCDPVPRKHILHDRAKKQLRTGINLLREGRAEPSSGAKPERTLPWVRIKWKILAGGKYCDDAPPGSV